MTRRLNKMTLITTWSDYVSCQYFEFLWSSGNRHSLIVFINTLKTKITKKWSMYILHMIHVMGGLTRWTHSILVRSLLKKKPSNGSLQGRTIWKIKKKGLEANPSQTAQWALPDKFLLWHKYYIGFINKVCFGKLGLIMLSKFLKYQ